MILNSVVKYLFIDYAIKCLFTGIFFNFNSIKYKTSAEISPGDYFREIYSPGNEMLFLDCKIIDTYHISNSLMYSDKPCIMILFTYTTIIGLRTNGVNHTTIIEPLDNLRAKYVL